MLWLKPLLLQTQYQVVILMVWPGLVELLLCQCMRMWSEQQHGAAVAMPSSSICNPSLLLAAPRLPASQCCIGCHHWLMWMGSWVNQPLAVTQGCVNPHPSQPNTGRVYYNKLGIRHQ